MNKLLRILLILLGGFLALTAFAGGIGLLAGLNAPRSRCWPGHRLNPVPFLVLPCSSLWDVNYLQIQFGH